MALFLFSTDVLSVCSHIFFQVILISLTLMESVYQIYETDTSKFNCDAANCWATNKALYLLPYSDIEYVIKWDVMWM